MGLFGAIGQALADNPAVEFDFLQHAAIPTPSASAWVGPSGTDRRVRSEDSDVTTFSPTASEGAPSASIASAKPILQLNALPVTIDSTQYKNPLSTGNPGGSLTSLWAFRELVDPVPAFTRYYSGGSSTETYYSLVVAGASVGEANPFATGVLSQARKQLAQSRYANMDGTDGTWAPVYATPADWYDTSKGRYLPLNFDLNSAGGADSPFNVLSGGENPLTLQMNDGGDTPARRAVASGSRINQVSLKYLQVSLTRPWLNGMLFSTDGWFLRGQPKGFCSSGALDANPGVLPLLPVSILMATDVTVDAQWSVSDQRAIDVARAQGQEVSLGPFVIHPASAGATLQVFGWVTQLVPFSPRE